MESIKPLPEAVQSAVRSGFIIADLTTVVEELIYNSLDAGATKVSAYVGVHNGYIKVEDDGSGISRDGLLLLGERYATSRLPLSLEKGDVTASFGFRGEVLCSIADISLMEILTKVNGRPNGYRKVMKGRKCLYLSIDDDRQEVGTTVIVRDLFYNQPVRRRQMQSSTKKHLHSVKECAVRIALVQPKVSFKVVDIESENELLRTCASSLPLSVLCSNFGLEPSSLCELSFSEGFLKVNGHVSDPSCPSSFKAIQYIYVNSRFLAKGPIHKVVTRLADAFWDQLNGNRCGKRGQTSSGPAYCLNLTCPRSFYDLNLEFSKTYVDFKDWATVLAFIEKSVLAIWSKKAKKCESHNCGADQKRKHVVDGDIEDTTSVGQDWYLKKCQTSAKKHKIDDFEFGHAPARSSPSSTKIEFGNGSGMSPWEGIDEQKKIVDTEDLGDFPPPSQPEEEFPFLMETSISRRSRDLQKPCNFVDLGSAMEFSWKMEPSEFYPSSGIFDTKDETSTCSQKGLMSSDEDLSKFKFTGLKRDVKSVKDYPPRRKNGLSVDYPNGKNDKSRAEWSWDLGRDKMTDYEGELFTQNRASEDLIRTPSKYENNLRFQMDYCQSKRSCSNFLGSADADSAAQKIGEFQRAAGQNYLVDSFSMSDYVKESDLTKDLDFNSLVSQDPLSLYQESFYRDHTSEFQSKEVASSCFPASIDDYSAILHLNARSWDLEHFADNERQPGRLERIHFGGFEKLFDDKEVLEDDFGGGGGFESSWTEEPCQFSPGATQTVLVRKAFSDYPCSPSRDVWRKDYDHSPVWQSPSDSIGRDTVMEKQTCEVVRKSFSEYPCSPFREVWRKDYDRSPVWQSPSDSIDRDSVMEKQTSEVLGPECIPEQRLGRVHNRCSDDLFSATCEGSFNNETFSPSSSFLIKLNTPRVSSKSITKDPIIDPACIFPQQSGRSPPRLRRSESAPPHFRGKRRYLSVKDCSLACTISVKDCSLSIAMPERPRQTCSLACTTTESNELEHPPASPLFYSHHDKQYDMDCANDSPFCPRKKMNGISETAQDSSMWLEDRIESPHSRPGLLKEDTENSRIKWREDFPDNRLEDLVNRETVDVGLSKDKHSILEINSLMLQLTGNQLVPNSISRKCLENAKVLLQVDNKFIPVVAGGTLTLVDQHAADERIRLEDMRKKVLSGEMRSIAHLEEEKELVLPEMAYQLLCNYVELIKDWGWICNIFSQDSGSFAKNLNILNGQPTHLSLLAVPCILGVNLSDKDLLEFLEQLAETDGSSTIPPSVLHVLNYKSCRGAIMFGDKLLPSECALIVEELKQTSLCFQCAHGRPTTVPLVDLEALREGIAQLESFNEQSNKSWHGLSRNQISVERAEHRLR